MKSSAWPTTPRTFWWAPAGARASTAATTWAQSTAWSASWAARENPVRNVLNHAADHFLRHLPIVYVQTVVGAASDGGLAVRGLYIGDDIECFLRAAELSLKVNFEMLEEPIKKAVVYLDPNEFHSTWIGNKAVYRTRMALADGAELIILAPRRA